MLNSMLYKLRKSIGEPEGTVVCMVIMAVIACVTLVALFFLAKQLFKFVLYIIGSTARVKAVAVMLLTLAVYAVYRAVTSDKWEWIKTLLLDGS